MLSSNFSHVWVQILTHGAAFTKFGRVFGWKMRSNWSILLHFGILNTLYHHRCVINQINMLKKKQMENVWKYDILNAIWFMKITFKSKFAIFIFFYISRKKYWFRANFWFPVFHGFTCFGMSWTRFDYFWKMSVCLSVCVSVCLCVCDKNFVASVARELMNRISWNFVFSITPI